MKFIFALLFIVSIIGCSESHQESLVKKRNDSVQAKDLEKEAQRVVREKIVGDVSKKYHVSCILDTVTFQYSVEYEPYINDKNILISKFYLIDVYQKDSSEYMYLSVGDFFDADFDLDLKISKSLLEAYHGSANPVLVVQIEKIRKIKYELDVDADYNEDNSIRAANIDLTRMDRFKGRGVGSVVAIIPTKKAA